jgi:hypothetical protein
MEWLSTEKGNLSDTKRPTNLVRSFRLKYILDIRLMSMLADYYYAELKILYNNLIPFIK